MSRLRVALVVHRYGAEIAGGAERFARLIAELLADDVDVTVLTTRAYDYVTWDNHYPPGTADVNGVRVLRFPVSEPRARDFDDLCELVLAAPDDAELNRAWMRAQGPTAPDLTAYVRKHGDDYDVFVFLPYLYATTADTLPLVADRAILAPLAHDEPWLRLSIFDDVFSQPRLIVSLTPEECELVRRRAGAEDARFRIISVGVDDPPASDPARFAATAGLKRPYALYVGRLDVSKGVRELLAHHERYRRACPQGLDLVVGGEGPFGLPDAPWLVAPGVVPEQAKHDALAGAAVVVLPSPYESLSLVQLEAWSHGRPTLANAESAVLVGQSRRAGGGLWYSDGVDYVAALDLLAQSPSLADAIGRQGRRYVHAAYSWDEVRRTWLKALSEVAAVEVPA